MLYVLLLILKIIGILLLSILGLLVLTIGILLFVPIRYKVAGEYREKGILKCQVHWLLRIIHCGVHIDTKASPVFGYGVRIFGFTMMGTDKKPKKQKQKKKKSKRQSVKNEKAKLVEKTELIEKTESFEKMESFEKTEPVIHQKSQEDEQVIEKKKNISFIEKLKKIWKKLINWLKSIAVKIKNIKYTIEKMCDKIVKWRETYEYYLDLLDREETKAAIKLCKKQLCYMGKKLKPQKFLCNIHFGLDDPSITGQILAIYGMLYPVIGNNVLVQADFESVFVEGDIYIKGKIKIYTLVKVAIIVYFNKNVKALLKLLRREEIKDGRK